MKIYTTTKQAISTMLVLLPFAAMAQTNTDGQTDIASHETDPRLFSHVSAHKTTSDNASRLIALTKLRYSGPDFDLIDSTVFAYPGGRGSVVNINGMNTKDDSDVSYAFNPSAGSYSNSFRNTQTFDANNNIVTTTGQGWFPHLAGWRNYNQSTSTYDAANNQLTYTLQNWDTVANAWANLWNSWNYTYTYNTSNQVTSMLLQKWNIVTSSWRNSKKETYSYNAGGNRIQTLIERWDTTAVNWVNTNLHTMTYNSAGDMVDDTIKLWSSAAWVKSTFVQYSSFVDHNPQTITWQGWSNTAGSYINAQKEIYTYNSFGQPTYWEDVYWNSGIGSWQRTTNSWAKRFYYETYVSSVKGTATQASKADIFPVPAQNELHINATWNESQEFSVSIVDMQGRICKTWDVPTCIQYTAMVPTTNLAAGNYIIKLSGAKGVITRQIVVAK